MQIYRGDSLFSIGPFHSNFSEEIILGGSTLKFKLKKSRFLNPFFYSHGSLIEGQKRYSISSRFRKVKISTEAEPGRLLVVSVPFLFPFFSIGMFSINLPEGQILFEIGRCFEKDGLMYGSIYKDKYKYRYYYKFGSYKNLKTNMFIDGLPRNLSLDSLLIILFIAVWLNAYNADNGHS